MTQYEYGLERIAAYTATDAEIVKTQYVYDVRGSVIQTITGRTAEHIAEATETPTAHLPSFNVQPYAYTPFGEQMGAKISGYTYNGESYDAATGMVNLRARQYEPAQMRFSQPDLVRGYASNPPSLNRYAYCLNDPITYDDPSGKLVHTSVASMVRPVTDVRTNRNPVAGKARVNTAASTVKSAYDFYNSHRYLLALKNYETLSEKDQKIIEDGSRKLKVLNKSDPEYVKKANQIIAYVCSNLSYHLNDENNTYTAATAYDIRPSASPIPMPAPAPTIAPNPTPNPVVWTMLLATQDMEKLMEINGDAYISNLFLLPGESKIRANALENIEKKMPMHEKTVLYVVSQTGEFYDRSRTAIPFAGRGGGTGYPDVIGRNGVEVWEIKPLSPYGFASGAKQMYNYTKDGKHFPGHPIANATVQYGNGYLLIYSGLQEGTPGVVYYQYEEEMEKVKEFEYEYAVRKETEEVSTFVEILFEVGAGGYLLYKLAKGGIGLLLGGPVGAGVGLAIP